MDTQNQANLRSNNINLKGNILITNKTIKTSSQMKKLKNSFKKQIQKKLRRREMEVLEQRS